MDRIINRDESWFSNMTPDTKLQSLEWCSKGLARPKKARMSKSKVKFLLVCFFDSIGIVPKELVPAAQRINQYYYTEILERLRKRVMWVSPNMEKNCILNRDNAPTHEALSVVQLLTSQYITMISQPP